MPYVIAIAALLLALFIVFIRTSKGKGWWGEQRVKLVLGRTKRGRRYVLNGMIIQFDHGGTTEIDHVVVNPRGVFVIETKNRAGKIYGTEEAEEWVQVLAGGKVRNKMRNPLLQNGAHVRHVSHVLAERIHVTSAVVFVQGNIQHIESSDVYTLRGLRRLLRRGPDRLSQRDMERLYVRLTDADRSDEISHRRHVQNIRDMQAKVEDGICPRCGKPLVERYGGDRTFFVCSGAPKCKFSRAVEHPTEP